MQRNLEAEVIVSGARWRCDLQDRISSPAADDADPVWQDPTGLAISRLPLAHGQGYQLDFWGEAVAAIDLSERSIALSPLHPEVTAETLEHFLRDQILPRLIAHEGALVIHAGAVEHNGAAVLVVGESGRGKSTLVASLDAARWPLLGDDAMVLSWAGGRPEVRAVYPGLRLLPDSIDALFDEPPVLEPMAHYSSKQRVSLRTALPVDREALPVAAIFLMDAPSRDGSIRIAPVAPAAACMAIVAQSFALDPVDPELAAGRMREAARLVESVPVYDLGYPRDYALLRDVHAAIGQALAGG